MPDHSRYTSLHYLKAKLGKVHTGLQYSKWRCIQDAKFYNIALSIL